jgi:hypothetical protein
LIEEIENKEDAKMGKKMLELREQFKKERWQYEAISW